MIWTLLTHTWWLVNKLHQTTCCQFHIATLCHPPGIYLDLWLQRSICLYSVCCLLWHLPICPSSSWPAYLSGFFVLHLVLQSTWPRGMNFLYSLHIYGWFVPLCYWEAKAIYNVITKWSVKLYSMSFKFSVILENLIYGRVIYLEKASVIKNEQTMGNHPPNQEIFEN